MSPSPDPLRILIVDDHVDSAESLSELLSLQGCSTRMAHDGWQALLVARAWEPQMMLVDLELPGLDGQEVARRVRACEWARNTLLIALSGWSGDEARDDALRAGFDQHMVKPVDLDRLDALVAQAIATQAAATHQAA